MKNILVNSECIVRKEDGQLFFLGVTQDLKDAVDRCNSHTQTEEDLATLAEVPVWDEDVVPIIEILPARIRHFV